MSINRKFLQKYSRWIITIAIAVVLLVMFLVQRFWGTDESGFIFNDPSQPYIKVHVLDVGQADAILIELPGHRVIMIDAGTYDSKDKIKAYIDKLGIQKIDYLIGTHPHDDHIGGMPQVIENFEIGCLYLPQLDNNFSVHLKEKAQLHGVPIKRASAGVTVLQEADIKVEILAPYRNVYEDENDYSAVVKVVYKNNKFLFAADATSLSEAEMIADGADLDADVLKIAHHGADTSSSQAFLNAVSPKYAAISVGKDNNYGFPDSVVNERLDRSEIKVYRTDRDGTIVFFGNGQRIGVQTER